MRSLSARDITCGGSGRTARITAKSKHRGLAASARTGVVRRTMVCQRFIISRGASIMTDAVTEPMRPVRPWIAALLSLLLGWGAGFFYARRTRTAVWLSVASVVLGLLAAAVLVYGVWMHASWVPRKSPGVWKDFAGLVIGSPFAAWAWIAAARRPMVKKAGAARLLGYLVIWLAPIFVSFALAITTRWLLVQPFWLPSGSMQPTLPRGAYILATKWVYGYSRYSFVPLDGFLPPGRWRARTPERGDIVVFRPAGETRDFVKRIVGMPADHIQMIDGVLRINGASVELEARGKVRIANSDIPAFRETLPNGVSYTVLDRYPDWELDNTRVFVVPADHYFLLGDDRDSSQDSRTVLVGFVPFENLIGRIDSRTQYSYPRAGTGSHGQR